MEPSRSTNDRRRECEDALAALAADPAFAGLARADAAWLVWDRSGRIVWASHGAAALGAALATGEDGGVDPALPALARIRALAAGGAPRQGLRLERLRFAASRLVPPTTCACRLVTLPSGQEVLVTVIVGAVPKLAPAAQDVVLGTDAEPTLPAAEPDTAVQFRSGESAAADPIARLSGRGTVRFLWQTDAEGRFSRVSDQLAALVGAAAADVIGRTWDEVAGRLVDDPTGEVSGLFARQETWSGRTVHWRIGGIDRAVAVDLAAMPVFDREHRFAGLRGFGLVRTDVLSERPRLAEGATADAAAAAEARAGTDAGPSPAPEDDLVSEAAIALGETVEARPDEASEASPDAAAGSGETAEAAEAGQDPDDAPCAEPATTGDGVASEPESRFETVQGHATARLGAAQAPLRPLDAVEAIALPAEVSAALDPEAAPSEAWNGLSQTERSAFRDIARALGVRFESDGPLPEADASPEAEPAPEAERSASRPAEPPETDARRILDRLPIGILVHRGGTALFANRALLDLAGWDGPGRIAAEGGIERLFQGRIEASAGDAATALLARPNENIAVEIRSITVAWDGEPADLTLVRRMPEADPAQRLRATELDLRACEARIREMSSILDTATDGVIVLDEAGRMLSLNRSAEALFGYDQNEVAGEGLAVLLAPESHAVARDYLEGLRANGVASLLNDGREVLGRVRQGGTIPLFMTMGRVGEGPERKFCAVLRDITAFKKAESELTAAKRAAEEASTQKSDFLAKVSHEVRTPLNAIIGFAEVMLEERFGPVGNERYKDYLRDIHASGGHVISLVNDLLDLAKIEAGRMELSFTSVSLNDLISASVTLMQTQAARARIVMRTSFAPKLPPVVADERSVRQIVLNLVSNAIKFTDAGGQIIVSTAVTDRGEVAFRVRDTGIGMTEQEVATALEPFRQLSTSRRGGGTGLGLPLTKALVEANRGALHISSARNEGTLVEVLFPPTRVLAE